MTPGLVVPTTAEYVSVLVARSNYASAVNQGIVLPQPIEELLLVLL